MGLHPTLEKPNFVGNAGVALCSKREFLFAAVRLYSPEIVGFAVTFAVRGE